MPIDAQLDHIVLAAPVLADAVAQFADRTGVQPAPGGSHPGWGTANYLVGLGGDAYLEIVGPDPSRSAPDQPRPFRIDELTAPRVVTWAVHPPDADTVVAAARARGYDPGELAPMSRQAPGGDLLRWRLTAPELDRHGGLVPFLIDWGTTPHPTTRGLPQTRLVSFHATHPDVAAVRSALAALDVELDIEGGPPGLVVVVEGSAGPVTLGWSET